MLNYDCVIIDSGVNLLHSKLKNSKIDGISLTFDNSMNLVVGNNIQDRLGHGTAVYSIIKQNSPMKSTIYNINIFQDCDAVDEDLLISAILYIEENINCRVINISSGIKLCERLIEFRNICNRISDKGIFIVSAFDNDGAMSYPAAFDSVIGVDISNDCLKIFDYEYVENSPINIRAKGGFHKVCWTDPEYVIVQGSSFSCAYITSIILDKIYSVSEMKSDQLHRILREYVKLIYNYNSDLVKIDNKYFNPKNVLLFPINKEMHSLLAFSSLLPFSISNITDLKISGNVNRKIEDIISFKKLDTNILSLKIENIDAIDWKSKFDTIIIGHVQSLSKISKRDLLKELLSKCIIYRKNVIAFDDLSKYSEECSILIKNDCLVYSPKKTCLNLQNRFGKLYNINKPVICVAGTSSSQGKNTLQLYLREQLTSIGYKVGQLGSEPTAKLFQMDEIYHYGYSVINTDYFEQTILSVNNLMRNIELSNPDIIITGLQSGTVPYAFDNIQYLTNRQLELLIGISPDIVILCVNSYDDFDYIQRTISVIENFSCCKVICCVLYPMKYNEKFLTFGKKVSMSESEMNSICDLFSCELMLPVIPLIESRIKDIINIILDYFSE